MTGSPPTLPAYLHPLVRAFANDCEGLRAAVARYGTPVNLIFPQIFTENLARLTTVLEEQPMRYRICYAHKVNRSSGLLRTAAAAGISVDIASPQECDAALRAGFTPDRIEATGPKGRTFLQRLSTCAITVNIDNAWELNTLAELASVESPVPVLLRVSGFAGMPVSRFGVPVDRVDAALDDLATNRDRLNFLGFAFHLDSGATADRIHAVDTCLALVERAYDRGLTPSTLDIGGGFRQVFTDNAAEFEGYVRALRNALIGRGSPMSWGSNTFGYQVNGMEVHGTPVFHKYANSEPADRMLAELLTTPLEQHAGRQVAQVVADNLLDVWIEPGKALVDHAGATVATVDFVKEASDGSVLVTVDLSRDGVTPADQEVMVDPLLLPSDPSRQGSAAEPVGVYFAGRLCLERDLITAHKVWVPALPQPGDVVVFPNTAAYNMDLSAAGAAMHPLPEKLAVTRTDGDFRVCSDEDYRPGPVDAHRHSEAH